MNKLIQALSVLNILNETEISHLSKLEIIDVKTSANHYVFTVALETALAPDLYHKINYVKYDEIVIETKIAVVRKITHEDIKKYLYYVYEHNQNLLLFKKHIDLDHFQFSPHNNILAFNYVVDQELTELNHVIKQCLNVIQQAFGLPTISFEVQKNDELQERLKAKQELCDQEIAKVIDLHKHQDLVKSAKHIPKIEQTHVHLKDLLDGMVNVAIKGQVFNVEIKDLAKLTSYRFLITDYETTFVVRYAFFKETKYQGNRAITEALLKEIKVDDWIIAVADIKSDRFENEIYGNIKKIQKTTAPHELTRVDDAPIKRIELAMHTKMSAFDGVVDPEELINKLLAFKHTAVGITDRFNIQSFPSIQKLAKKNKIKAIYGCEFNMYYPARCVLNEQSLPIQTMEYVVFDLETTGLNAACDDIIEFGGIKYQNGIQVETLQFFIKPQTPVTSFTTQLTGITNDDLKNAIDQETAIVKILNFVQDAVLIAHNAINFDFRFLTCKAEKYLAKTLTNPVVDTLHIARALYPQLKSHTLEKVCRELKVEYGLESAHRADYDAKVLNNCWSKMLEAFKTLDIHQLDELNTKLTSRTMRGLYQGDYVYVYAKNAEGLKKLNELVSLAHTEHLYNTPKIPRHLLDANRKNLVIVNHPLEGEVIRAALTGTVAELKQAIARYDFIFVTPVSKFLPLIKSNELTESDVIRSMQKIINFALEQNKKIIAVSDAYYLDPWDKKYQNVYLYAKALNGRHHRFYRSKVLPDQHFRTTQEMIDEFQFLNNQQLVKEIVIDNSLAFSKLISDDIFPIKDRLFAPQMENVDEKLKTQVFETAHKIYGTDLPNIVSERLERELKAIITHQFSVVYWVAHLLVTKSNQDGYPVGSRGSVGSSLVATMLSITDVNPLAPHYICPHCYYCEFIEGVEDGYDLPPKLCPHCQHTNLKGEGHNIPFETFLGFKGDKVPDIDLNFSGIYQPQAHNFIREIFGKSHTFRAGTISTIAEKTCFSIVKSYFEEINQFDMKPSELNLYVKKCQNVKRTTGQHPGGILIIPKEYSIFDFSPYNYPADDAKSDWYTTHYAFEFLHDSILKFDILGHDNPTILRKLKDLTGVDEKDVPNYDPLVLQLFSSTDPLQMLPDSLCHEKNGAISIPEFGTKFVREMLVDTQPQSFADLIRISGLSHGTNVYLGNAKSLIKQQALKLKNVIACRDDILIYLIQQGIDHSTSFKIMEDVRKGKQLLPEYVEIMKAKKVPNWYIESCNKIAYIFPKAHATAYVMHAWKFAWYKIYYPLPYYATFLSTKADAFDIDTIIEGATAINTRMQQIESLLANRLTASQVKKKEQDLLVVLEVCLEMVSRGFKIYKPDIYKSEAVDFLIFQDGLIAPFNCIDGIGEEVAKTIVEARSEKPFASVDDIIARTKLSNTLIGKLEQLGVLADLPKSNQLRLFDDTY